MFILSAFVSRMLVATVIISLEGRDDEVVRSHWEAEGVPANWNYVTSCLCLDSFAMRFASSAQLVRQDNWGVPWGCHRMVNTWKEGLCLRQGLDFGM